MRDMTREYVRNAGAVKLEAALEVSLGKRPSVERQRACPRAALYLVLSSSHMSSVSALILTLMDGTQWTMTSAESGGGICLCLCPTRGLVSLLVFQIWDGPRRREEALLRSGDRLECTYRNSVESPGSSSSLASLASLIGPRAAGSLAPGHRVGLDMTYGGRTVRLSHPPEGAFGFMVDNGNPPLDHARCGIAASNATEDWYWQLGDLYDGDGFWLEVVETDWNTPFPRIERVR